MAAPRCSIDHDGTRNPNLHPGILPRYEYLPKDRLHSEALELFRPRTLAVWGMDHPRDVLGKYANGSERTWGQRERSGLPPTASTYIRFFFCLNAPVERDVMLKSEARPADIGYKRLSFGQRFKVFFALNYFQFFLLGYIVCRTGSARGKAKGRRREVARRMHLKYHGKSGSIAKGRRCRPTSTTDPNGFDALGLTTFDGCFFCLSVL